MYTVSYARRDTGKENWLNSSRQDLHRVNPIGPKSLYTPAKEKGTAILKMEREFLRKKKVSSLWGSFSSVLQLYNLSKPTEALVVDFLMVQWLRIHLPMQALGFDP